MIIGCSLAWLLLVIDGQTDRWMEGQMKGWTKNDAYRWVPQLAL